MRRRTGSVGPGNQGLPLLDMIEANYGHVNRFTRTQVSLATGKAKPQSEHHQILDYCRESKVNEAVALLERHIEQTQKSIRASSRRLDGGR